MSKLKRIFFLMVITAITHVQAQDYNKSEYDLLSLEIEMLRSYQQFSDDVNTLIDSAMYYATADEYEIATAYLEEAKASFDNKKTMEIMGTKSILEEKEIITLNITSGIDYNKQEFELGYEQSDSVLKEELNKPFIRLDVQMNLNETMQVENRLRYDKENFQEELRLKKDYLTSQTMWGFNTGFIYDKNYKYVDLGYTQLSAEAYIKSPGYGSDWYWNINNTIRYKNYVEESEVLPDFFRNTLSAYVIRNFYQYDNIQFDYNLDYNESLKYSNNDFVEHDMGISYEAVYFSRFKIKMGSRYRYDNFNYLLSDSAFTNTSQTLTFNPDIRIALNKAISLDFEYKIDSKKYNKKTEHEPDYMFNYINPAFVINFNDFSSLNLGYLYEDKTHEVFDYLDSQYIEDQNYTSKGISAGLDFSSISGLLISLSAEYALRRYPNSQSDANFSIYSNRNIFSLLFYAQIPLGENFLINAIGSYDNDKDIDSDFNDTVASFYTFEILYHFR